jgi:hypothetical protein
VIHNVRAVTLWSRRSREADKVVGLFTREFGRVTARATSAAKATAKFAALTEPFVESEIALYLVPGRGWGKIVGGKILSTFPALRTDVTRSTAASWICEVVYRLTPEEQESPEKFDLLREALMALAVSPNQSMIRLGFAIRFLAIAGFGVQNREPWGILAHEHPAWAEGLTQTPLETLGTEVWQDPMITAVEHLAGSIVSDHLNRPLQVNRFRQLAGIEI